jgi:hypothetical protein
MADTNPTDLIRSVAPGHPFIRRDDMSKKKLDDKLDNKTEELSVDQNVNLPETEKFVFYQCSCPKCGEEGLNLMDSGLFENSNLFGITSDGEIGCSEPSLDGGYEYRIHCSECGSQVYPDYSLTVSSEEDFLLSLAESKGKALTILPFHCLECGSDSLQSVEIGIEFESEVVAVCEAHLAGAGPLVAVSPHRDFVNRGTFRYRCSKGHEVTKEDGSPVQNKQELVAWLKAHATP